MKTRIYNEEQTMEIYFMMIHLSSYYERQLKQDLAELIKGNLTHAEVEKTKLQVALAKDLLNFFKEAKTTMINEMPF